MLWAFTIKGQAFIFFSYYASENDDDFQKGYKNQYENQDDSINAIKKMENHPFSGCRAAGAAASLTSIV